MKRETLVWRWLICWALVITYAPSGVHADSPFALRDEPERERSDLLMPTISFLLPGFDQWVQGQYGYGAFYSGVALGGVVYAGATAAANDIAGRRAREEQLFRDAGEDYTSPSPIGEPDIAERKIAFGTQLYQSMGGMSAYHSFRTAVRSRQDNGQYSFLRHEESPQEVLLAPFDFSYLKRSSTLIPLGVIAVYSAILLNAEIPEESGIESRAFGRADAAFTLGYSYNAGTHEEAMFRGWIQPAMRQYSGSDFWSNGLTSLLFAAAHLGDNQFPIVQAILGYHMGSVTMANDWRIGEAVFIHTWWDVFAFATTYHYKRKLPEPVAAAVQPIFWLPALKLAF